MLIHTARTDDDEICAVYDFQRTSVTVTVTFRNVIQHPFEALHRAGYKNTRVFHHNLRININIFHL